jgi:hypothetical protein
MVGFGHFLFRPTPSLCGPLRAYHVGILGGNGVERPARTGWQPMLRRRKIRGATQPIPKCQINVKEVLRLRHCINIMRYRMCCLGKTA